MMYGYWNIRDKKETYCCLFLALILLTSADDSSVYSRVPSRCDVGSFLPTFPLLFFSLSSNIENYFILFDKNSKFCGFYHIFLPGLFIFIYFIYKVMTYFKKNSLSV